MYCQSEEMQADCLSKNASTLFLPLAFLRVSALPELNYTALANEASVYGIAQYHAILSSAAGTTTMLCSVVNISVTRLCFRNCTASRNSKAAPPEEP